MSSRICRKTQQQMFLSVDSGGHILCFSKHSCQYKALQNLGEMLFQISRRWNYRTDLTLGEAWLWTAILWKSHENAIKNPGKHFSGPWIQIFHFHGLFFRPWIFYEKLIMGFMAHEIAMKYLPPGFMSHEKLVCYRFHGPWKLHSEISGVVKNEKW